MVDRVDSCRVILGVGRRRFFVLFCAVGFVVLSFALNARNDSLADRVDQEWRAFRSVYPLHTQVIAVHERIGRGRALVILSEPPPHVTLRNLKARLPASVRNLAIKEQRIGFDGLLKDVVFTVPATNDGAVQTLVSQLSEYLFFTNYKAQYLVLPARKRSASAPRLNLRIPSESLRKWTAGSNAAFESLYSGGSVNFAGLLRATVPGVFFSKQRGLVVLAVPGDTDLSELRPELRQFALDSDLVLGAVAGPEAVLILARERRESPDIVPPLRTETILMLAAESNAEIAQSFERNHVFAGKLADGADWAPIYLSENLINTEYGSLLNLTDQLLKGWSMNGTVEYSNFRYPMPSPPPFRKPISHLVESGSVTFNWNTYGAGYTVETGEQTILALNRTGSLPMSYLAGEDRTSDFERKGYDYFASRNDPNLARVVQYAALYQIFRRFDLRAAPQSKADGARFASANRWMAGEVFSVLEKVRTADDDEVDEVVRRLARNENILPENVMQLLMRPLLETYLFETLKSENPNLSDADISRHVEVRINSISEQEVEELATVFESQLDSDQKQELREALLAGLLFENLPSLQGVLRALHQSWGVSVIEKVGRKLADPQNEIDYARARQALIDDDDSYMSDPDLAADLLALRIQADQDYGFLWAFADLDRIKAGFVERGASDAQDSWIVTPSIVESSGGAGAIGGHNLNSAVSRFRASSKVQRGTVQVARRGTHREVLFHPADAGKVPDLLMHAGRNADDPNLVGLLTRALKKAPGQKVEPMRRALAIRSPKSQTRGLDPLADANRHRISTGWSVVRKPMGVEDRRILAAMNSHHRPSLLVRKNIAGRIELLMDGEKNLIEIKSPVDFADAVAYGLLRSPAGKQGWHLSLDGFTKLEAEAFRQTLEVRLAKVDSRPDGARAIFSKFDAVASKTIRGSPSRNMANEFDFSQAVISTVETRQIGAGIRQGQHAVEMSIQVPARGGPTADGLLIRIAVFFKNTVPQLFQERLVAAIRRILGKNPTEYANPERFAREVRTELESARVPEKNRMQIELEFGDFYVVQRPFTGVEAYASIFAYGSESSARRQYNASNER